MSTVNTIVKDDKTFKTIELAVNEMVDLIRPTFGPASNKVIIDKPVYRMVVDDGVQIARDFQLDDPAQNAVVKVIREVLVTTNDRAGDGTTGAAIMLQGMINEVGRRSSFNGRKIELELKKGLEEVKKHLEESSIEIKTKEDLKKVALVSFDDEPIAEMLADTYFELGKDAIITIDKSPTMETTVEKSDGLEIKSGYISPYMVTNPQRMETEIMDAHFLITDYRITEANDVLPIMNAMMKEGKNNLIIIAENVEQQALATMVVNLPHVMNPQTQQVGKFMSIAIAAPKMLNQKQFLEDVALLTGATMFTESKGNKLQTAKVEDLGKAAKVIVNQDSTIVVDPKGNKTDIAVSITSLREMIKTEKVEADKKQLEERLAVFTNTLAVIKVGAATEQESKALKYKVEDARNSVKSAFQHGVVCGSGLALANIKTSSSILNEALQYPARQLRENMGLDENLNIKAGEALNVVTGKIGAFLDVGVVDPVDVLLAGVESAVSITSLLLTSKGMIVETQKQD